MFSHEVLLKKHNIAVTDLPEKTQKKIAKFAASTDEDERETADIAIHSQVMDYVADKTEKEKAEAKKAAHAADKAEATAAKEAAKAKKGVDVSDAPTAKGKEAAPATPAPKERSMFDRIYGRK